MLEEGIFVGTCTHCGETKTVTLPPVGYDWDKGKITKEPTCVECEKIYTCNRCGSIKTEILPELLRRLFLHIC